MMENGKNMSKKIRILNTTYYDDDITIGKVYDVLCMNEVGRVSFINDIGNWDSATKDQYEIFKDNEHSAKPSQYQIGIDTFERMRANATYEEAMGFIRWNIDKYNTRQKGQDEDDYKKIISYAQEALWWIRNK